ncbi:MAG: tetratricopeptide repeat protein [Candidatus Obscuribacter sp.]|nr:tetratricopeptide repeat protein [Candidatus Obscuribacter sp.]
MHKQVTILLCLLSMLACQSGAAEPLTNTKRAKQHADCEEWQSAIEIYTKELAAHPKDAECLAGRGLAYARQGNLQQAFADFSYAIKCDPNCTEAYSNRSRVYEWLGLIGPARKDAEQALARVSTVTQDLDSIMRQAGLLNCVGKKIEAETEYNHALLLCSKDADLSALLDAACAHYQLEHLKDSLNCLTQAHNLSPKNAYIYYLRACVYKSLYQWTLATDELNQHLALIPNNPLALNLRGDCAAAQENYKTAIAFYTAATKIAPSFASAFRSRGFIYRILGEYPKAIEDFTTVIDLDSTDFFSFAERAYARCQLKEWALALKDAQQANSLNPNYAPVYRYKALAQGKLGFFTEAIDALNKYISLEPETLPDTMTGESATVLTRNTRMPLPTSPKQLN